MVVVADGEGIVGIPAADFSRRFFSHGNRDYRLPPSDFQAVISLRLS
jgi:hypothetical protein